MDGSRTRKWLPVAISCLLLAGVLTPIVVLGQSTSSTQQNQLAAMISAAEVSRSYAKGAIDLATANGLSVGAAQAQLSRGDTLLAEAQADAGAGTNQTVGVRAAQAAMSDYAGAATSASLALSNAGLAGFVDYYVALSAVADVNDSISAMATAAAQVCGATSAPAASAQACGQVGTDTNRAKMALNQATSLLAQSNGHVATSADVSQALSLAAQARTDLQDCQSLLLTIASYGYSQRGQAYISAVVDPPYADANATVGAEQALLANLSAYDASFMGYARSQASAAGNVSASASSLATAMSQVDTGSVSTNIGIAESTAGDVGTAMSELLNLLGVFPFPSSVVTDIHACASATSEYNADLGTTETWNGGYTQAVLSGFSTYLSTGVSAEGAVGSAGSAYVSACNQVISDLSGLSSPPPAVTAIYDTLVNLQISNTVSSVNASLQQEVTAMTAVQDGISSLGNAISSDESEILVGSDLLAAAAGVSGEGNAYLYATAAAAMGQVSASAQLTAAAAQSYVASAQSLLQENIGNYADGLSSLTGAGSYLNSKTQGSASAATSALSYVQSDLEARASEVAAGQGFLAQAQARFSGQDVSGGVTALAQAYQKFQIASSTSASA